MTNEASQQRQHVQHVQPPQPPQQTRGTGLLLAVLLGGQAMANVDIAIVNVAVPSIERSLHTTGGQTTAVVAGYTLAYAILLSTGARLGGMLGHGRVFLWGVGAFTAASLACGAASGPASLILARIGQGAAAAFMVPQVLVGIHNHFEGQKRARAIGYYAVALSASAAFGQAMSGFLIAANVFGSGWRSVFLVNVPIGILLIAAGARRLGAERGHGAQGFDGWGVLTFSVAMALVVAPVVFGRDMGWGPTTWICLGASVPAFGAFIAIERGVSVRGGRPLLDLGIVARPEVAFGLLSQAAVTATYFSLLFVLALYLQRGLGKAPEYSGLALVPWVLAFGVAGPVLSRIPRRVGRFSPVVGCLLLTMAFASISWSTRSERAGDDLRLLALLGLGGLGLGTTFSGQIANLTAAVPVGNASDLSGLFNTMAQVAACVGVAVFGTLYFTVETRATTSAIPSASSAFSTVAASLAAMAMLGAIAAYLSVRRPMESAGDRSPSAFNPDTHDNLTRDERKRASDERSRKAIGGGVGGADSQT
ncbi:MFS transporter [Pendulispora albinea]|uniref:MFS transporter n=1 Tax=Pendulispora albinea TaxID=2741071 RepID=A0ABZ2LS66_9BACT